MNTSARAYCGEPPRGLLLRRAASDTRSSYTGARDTIGPRPLWPRAAHQERATRRDQRYNHLLPPPAARMTRADHRGCGRYHPTTFRGAPTLPLLHVPAAAARASRPWIPGDRGKALRLRPLPFDYISRRADAAAPPRTRCRRAGFPPLDNPGGPGQSAAAAAATIRLHPAATTLPRLKYLPLPRATPGLTCLGKPPGKAALLLLLLPSDYIPRHRRCRASSICRRDSPPRA